MFKECGYPQRNSFKWNIFFESIKTLEIFVPLCNGDVHITDDCDSIFISDVSEKDDRSSRSVMVIHNLFVVTNQSGFVTIIQPLNIGKQLRSKEPIGMHDLQDAHKNDILNCHTLQK